MLKISIKILYASFEIGLGVKFTLKRLQEKTYIILEIIYSYIAVVPL
jgi:hypothetical protein